MVQIPQHYPFFLFFFCFRGFFPDDSGAGALSSLPRFMSNSASVIQPLREKRTLISSPPEIKKTMDVIKCWILHAHVG